MVVVYRSDLPIRATQALTSQDTGSQGRGLLITSGLGCFRVWASLSIEDIQGSMVISFGFGVLGFLAQTGLAGSSLHILQIKSDCIRGPQVHVDCRLDVAGPV